MELGKFFNLWTFYSMSLVSLLCLIIIFYRLYLFINTTEQILLRILMYKGHSMSDQRVFCNDHLRFALNLAGL